MVDGAGTPWFRADVAVKDGRIARIGTNLSGSALKTIDARGRMLAPGFIDVHVHVEGDIERDPSAENLLRDGVTSIITGNCGSSELELPAWFGRLDQAPLRINVGTLVGHNSVRSAVMGSANRPATPEELDRMRAMVDAAMKAGAFGFSTGLEYIPGAYAPREELIELAKVASRYGGLYATHMRWENERVLEAIDEALAVGRGAKIRVEISHLKQDTKRSWGMAPKMLAVLEAARAEGVDVVADQYPYDRSSTSLSIRVPAWALADGREKVRERFTTPSTKAEIVTGMKQMLAARGYDDYAWAMVVHYAPDRRFEGKTIPEVTRLTGREPTLDKQIETICEMILAGGAGMVYQVMSEQDIETILKWPETAVASDGGVRHPSDSPTHPRSYGTNARVLAEYARKRGLLTLEEAVRRMTSLPARTFGLYDRGLVREGMAADLVLFDPERVADRSTFSAPHQYSDGFDVVIVNGVLEVDEGKLLEGHGGRALRRAAMMGPS